MNLSTASPLGSTGSQEEQLVALFSAVNMATQAADEQIASESNKTTAKFCEMMEAMQASMQANAEAIHQLSERLAASEQRNKELALRQAESQAAEMRTKALEEKVSILSQQLAKSEKTFETHFHKTTICCVHSGLNCSTTPWQTQGPSLPPPPPPTKPGEGCKHQ